LEKAPVEETAQKTDSVKQQTKNKKKGKTAPATKQAEVFVKPTIEKIDF
jgi:hypothetical protein